MTPTKRKVLGQVWVVAFAKGRVELELKSYGHACQMRLDLYNSTRGVKADPEVVDAREHCQCKVEGNKLIVLRGDQDESVKAVAEMLGLEIEKPRTEMELSAERMMKLQEEVKIDPVMAAAREAARKFGGRS